MAYVPITLDPKTPKLVKSFIRSHLEMQLHDVHAMLRLPMRRQDGKFEEGLEAGCNFPAAGWLLALVSGVSTLVYSTETSSKKRFLKLMTTHYPWEPGASAAQDAEDLYFLFRNPLAHALGLPTDDTKAGVKRSAPSGSLGVMKTGLPEDLIEQFERSPARPSIAQSTIQRNAEGGRSLSVEGLYWGVRVMIQKLTADPTAMASAEKFLRT